MEEVRIRKFVPHTTDIENGTLVSVIDIADTKRSTAVTHFVSEKKCSLVNWWKL
jgi:hypothetical protein